MFFLNIFCKVLFCKSETTKRKDARELLIDELKLFRQELNIKVIDK